MSHHYLTLAASATALCDCCGQPARPTPDVLHQAYRRSLGFVFLCAACVPEHHEAYAATRVSPPFRAARDRRST
jgi:hypothetical protein